MSQSDSSSGNLSDSDGSPESTNEDSSATPRIPKPGFSTLEYRPSESGSPPVENPDESPQGVDPQTRNVAARYEPCEYHDHTFPPPKDGASGDSTLVWVAAIVGVIFVIGLIACAVSANS